MLKPHTHRPDIHEPLAAAFNAPSLYDEALRLLARRGLPVPADILQRDVTKPHQADSRVEDVWGLIYRESETHFDLYELAEELVDVEDSFQQWRFRHMKTVERIIGMRQAQAAAPAWLTCVRRWSAASSRNSGRCGPSSSKP